MSVNKTRSHEYHIKKVCWRTAVWCLRRIAQPSSHFIQWDNAHSCSIRRPLSRASEQGFTRDYAQSGTHLFHRHRGWGFVVGRSHGEKRGRCHSGGRSRPLCWDDGFCRWDSWRAETNTNRVGDIDSWLQPNSRCTTRCAFHQAKRQISLGHLWA